MKRNKLLPFFLSLVMSVSLASSLAFAEETEPIISNDYNKSSYFDKFYTSTFLWGTTARTGMQAAFKNYLLGKDATGSTALTDMTAPFEFISNGVTVQYFRDQPLPNVFNKANDNANYKTVELNSTFANLNGANLDFSLCIPTRAIDVSFLQSFAYTSGSKIDVTPFGHEYITATSLNATFAHSNNITTITGLQTWNVGKSLSTIDLLFYGCNKLGYFDISTWDLSHNPAYGRAFNSTGSGITSSLKPVTVYVANPATKAYLETATASQSNTNYTFAVKENSIELKNAEGTASADNYRSFTVKTSPKSGVATGVVIAALYDGEDKLVSCQIAEAADSVPFTFEATGYYVKVMWFEDTNDVVPMSAFKTIENPDAGKIFCTDISLSADSLSFTEETPQQLDCSPIPADTTDMLSFESSDTAIASVDGNGLITPGANGTCTITVSCGSVTKEVAVAVNITPVGPVTVPCMDITLSNTEFAFTTEGETKQIGYSLTPTGTTDIVSFLSSDDAVATVSETGLVSPVSNGSCTITVSCGDISKTIAVTVGFLYPCTDITFASPAMTFDGISVAQAIAYTLAPGNTTDTISFTSSDDTIVTVDAGGNVTPVSKGTCTISVKCGEVTKEIGVTVNEVLCTSIEVQKTAFIFDEPQTKAINYTVAPINTTDTVSFTSSDDTIATVSETGMITPVAEGACTISVSCGTQTADVSITVNDITKPYTQMTSYNYAVNNNIGETVETNGLTIVNNADGSVTCTGTSTADFDYYIDGSIKSSDTAAYALTAPSGLYFYSPDESSVETSLELMRKDEMPEEITEAGIVELEEGDAASYKLSFTNGSTYSDTVYPALYEGRYDREYVKGGAINYFDDMTASTSLFSNIMSDMELDSADFLQTIENTPMVTWIDDDFYINRGTDDEDGTAMKMVRLASEKGIKITFAAMYGQLYLGDPDTGKSGMTLAREAHDAGHEFVIHDTPLYWHSGQAYLEQGLKTFLSIYDLNGFVNYNAAVAPGGDCSTPAMMACREYVNCLMAAGGTGAVSTDFDDRFKISRVQISTGMTLDSVKSAIDGTIKNKNWLILFAHSSSDDWDREKFAGIMDYINQRNGEIKCMTLSEAIRYRMPLYRFNEVFE